MHVFGVLVGVEGGGDFGGGFESGLTVAERGGGGFESGLRVAERGGGGFESGLRVAERGGGEKGVTDGGKWRADAWGQREDMYFVQH